MLIKMELNGNVAHACDLLYFLCISLKEKSSVSQSVPIAVDQGHWMLSVICLFMPIKPTESFIIGEQLIVYILLF